MKWEPIVLLVSEKMEDEKTATPKLSQLSKTLQV